MRRSIRILAAVGCFLFILTALWLLGRTAPADEALRKFKAELQAKGEQLSFEELTKSRSTAVNTSHDTITNVARKLGPPSLSPALIPLRIYVAPGRAKVAWKVDSSLQSTNGLPPQAWEQFAAQLNTVETALAQVRLALRDPAPDAGPRSMTNFWSNRLDFVAIRQAAYWLSGAALSHLRQGELEPALQDLEAIAGLARMERDEYTLVAQMIRVAVAGVGLTTTWEALQSPGWTEPQLARLQRAWEQLELADAVEKGLLGERASGTEIWRLIRENKEPWRNLGLNAGKASSLLDKLVLIPVYRLTSINDDELLHLQISQEALDAVRLVQQHRSWPEIQQRLAKPVARLSQLRSWSAGFRYRVSALVVPNTWAATAVAIQRETEHQLTVTAIALRRFNLRYGAWPQNLDELIPDSMATMPADPMSGKNLRYRRDEIAGFILYSVGVDGKDDGGDPTPAAGSAPRLWDGRDAVWPAAAP